MNIYLNSVNIYTINSEIVYVVAIVASYYIVEHSPIIILRYF